MSNIEESTLNNKDSNPLKKYFNVDDINFLKASRHYRCTMFLRGKFYELKSKETMDLFNEWYAIKYPENAKILYLSKDE